MPGPLGRRYTQLSLLLGYTCTVPPGVKLVTACLTRFRPRSGARTLIDLHSHHIRCGHADDTLEAMARAAALAGVKVFGFSDHAPLFAHELDHPQPNTQMARSEWPAYLAEATELRDRLAHELPQLDLRIGTEADWLPGTQDVYRKELERANLDFVLGSVHEIGEIHIYRRSTHHLVQDADQLHRDYWRLTREAVESGLFDILAHMDAVRARLPKPIADMSGEITQTLDAIADSGIAVEINSAGLRKTRDLFPARGILEGLVRRGVPITFGSDSHRTPEVAFGYQAALIELRRLGVKQLVAFRAREMEWHDL